MNLDAEQGLLAEIEARRQALVAWLTEQGLYALVNVSLHNAEPSRTDLLAAAAGRMGWAKMEHSGTRWLAPVHGIGPAGRVTVFYRDKSLAEIEAELAAAARFLAEPVEVTMEVTE